MVIWKKIWAYAILGMGLLGPVQFSGAQTSLEERVVTQQTQQVPQQVKPAKKSYFKIIINPALPTLSYYHTVGSNTEVMLDNVLISYGRLSSKTLFGTNKKILEKRTGFYKAKMGSPLKAEELGKCYALTLDFYSLRWDNKGNLRPGGTYPYFIHFTDLTNSLGKPRSHGCIRMRWDDIRKIFPCVATKSNSRVDIIYNLARIYNGKLYLSGDLYEKGVDVGREAEKAIAGFPDKIPEYVLSQIRESVIFLRAHKSSVRMISLENYTNKSCTNK